MLAYLRGQLRHSLLRAAVLGLGILVAAVSFSLLTAAVQSSRAQVVGTVDESFRSAYDILVRPPGATTELERTEGLVQANFQSGIYGGITEAQWQQILDLPGVEVAAPVANVGYVLATASVRVQIPEAEQDPGERLYRVSSEWTAVSGSATFPGSQDFSYVSDQPDACSDSFLQATVPGPGRPDGTGFPPNDPTTVGRNCFAEVPEDDSPGVCFSRLTVGTDVNTCRVEAFIAYSFPMLVSAIDPDQESQLVGLDGTVVDGKMLRPEDTSRRTTPAPRSRCSSAAEPTLTRPCGSRSSVRSCPATRTSARRSPDPPRWSRRWPGTTSTRTCWDSR